MLSGAVAGWEGARRVAGVMTWCGEVLSGAAL